MLLVMVAGSKFLPAWAIVWLLVLISVFGVTILVAYIIFALRDPNLLRSEEFSLKQSALDICGSSEASGEELSRIIYAEQVSPMAYLEDKRDER